MIRQSLLVALVGLTFLGSSGCAFYQSYGKSTGAWLREVNGPVFEPLAASEWDQNNALLYFYRTDSYWGDDEIEAPSVYIDDQHYFNLRNAGYTWMEVSPGVRHIDMRRPLAGFEGIGWFSLSRIADADLRVEPGQVYYLRYSEVSEPDSVASQLSSDDPLASGDLRLVPESVALKSGELLTARFMVSELVAINDGGRSIVEQNQDVDYERDMERLEQEREEEIDRLVKEGRADPAPWYWPFAEGPDAPETDRKIAARKAEYEKVLEQRRRQKGDDGGWWPF